MGQGGMGPTTELLAMEPCWGHVVVIVIRGTMAMLTSMKRPLVLPPLLLGPDPAYEVSCSPHLAHEEPHSSDLAWVPSEYDTPALV